MKPGQRSSFWSEWIAAFKIHLAARSARYESWLDKISRILVGNEIRPPGINFDFERDELIDNHPGFDPDELDRYQRGEQ